MLQSMDNRDLPARRHSSFSSDPQSPQRWSGSYREGRDRYEDARDFRYDGSRDYRYPASTYRPNYSEDRDRRPGNSPRTSRRQSPASEGPSPTKPPEQKFFHSLVRRNPAVAKQQSKPVPEPQGQQQKQKPPTFSGTALDGTASEPSNNPLGNTSEGSTEMEMELDDTTQTPSPVAQKVERQSSITSQNSARKAADTVPNMATNAPAQASFPSQAPPTMAVHNTSIVAQPSNVGTQPEDSSPQISPELSESIQMLARSTAKRLHTERDLAEAKKTCKERVKDLQRVLGSEKAALRAMESASNNKQLTDREQRLTKQLRDETEESHQASRKLAKLLSALSANHARESHSSDSEQSLLRQSNRELTAKNHELESRLAKLEAVVDKLQSPESTPVVETHALGVLKDQVSKLETATNSALDRVKNLETDQDDQMEHMQRTETKLNAHKSESQRDREQVEQLKEQLEVLQQRLEQFQELFEPFQQQFETLKKQPELFQTKLEPITYQLGRLQNKLEKVQKREVDLTAKAEQYDTELKAISGKVSREIETNMQPRFDSLAERITEAQRETSLKVEALSTRFNVFSRSEHTAISHAPKFAESANSDVSASPIPPARTVPSQPASRGISSPGIMQGQLVHSATVVSDHPGVVPAPITTTPPATKLSLSQAPAVPTRQNSNEAIWRTTSAALSAPARESAAVRELSNRLLSIERLAGLHEQRLNFTSFEAVWPTLTRFVADYLAHNQNYPETVKKEIAGVKTTVSRCEAAMANQTQMLSNTLNNQYGAISSKLNVMEGSLNALKKSSDVGQVAIRQNQAEIGKIQSSLDEMSSRHNAAIAKYREELEAQLNNQNGLQPATEGANDSSELTQRIDRLQDEFQSLETYCFQEMSTLTGRIANVSGLVKGVSTKGNVDAPRPERSQTGKRNDASSSDESIIGSRRKRKRPN